MASVTKISGVSYRYPTSNPDSPSPIEDLNLQIQPGESVLICGGSGSGKSSVIRLLNGLIPNYHEGELTGTVTHGDHVINEEPLYNTGSFTATVFQNPAPSSLRQTSPANSPSGAKTLGWIRKRFVPGSSRWPMSWRCGTCWEEPFPHFGWRKTTRGVWLLHYGPTRSVPF